MVYYKKIINLNPKQQHMFSFYNNHPPPPNILTSTQTKSLYIKNSKLKFQTITQVFFL